MRETIYRDDAIDAICKACSIVGDYHKCDGYPETSTWCEELVALRALPSAEPEIIRCKDCKHSDTFPENADNDMPLKCLGIRYGGVFPDWYCEHAERRTNDG